MDHNPGKLRVFVRSRRVPVGITEFTRLQPITHNVAGTVRARTLVYENVLDDSQARLVAEAKRLADSSGLDLELVDLGRMGLIRRIFWSRIIWPAPTTTSTGLGLVASASPPSCTLP